MSFCLRTNSPNYLLLCSSAVSFSPLLSSALRKAISFIPLSPEAISFLSLQNLKHLKNDKIKRSAEKREREKGGKDKRRGGEERIRAKNEKERAREGKKDDTGRGGIT